jgi:hypothetical protein
MNDVEESAARSVQDETKTMCRSLLQRSPADHAEAFEPSLTMPSMPRTMFCSAALHSGEPDPLQSIKQSSNQSINQSIVDFEGDACSADLSRTEDQGQMLSCPDQHKSSSGTCVGLLCLH